MEIASNIVKAFPTENIQTYFIPSSGKVGASGILYFRYSNLRKTFKQINLIGKEAEPSPVIVESTLVVYLNHLLLVVFLT